MQQFVVSGQVHRIHAGTGLSRRAVQAPIAALNQAVGKISVWRGAAETVEVRDRSGSINREDGAPTERTGAQCSHDVEAPVAPLDEAAQAGSRTAGNVDDVRYTATWVDHEDRATSESASTSEQPIDVAIARGKQIYRSSLRGREVVNGYQATARRDSE
jgi:hypothetical protein